MLSCPPNSIPMDPPVHLSASAICLPLIAKDVAVEKPQSEEEAILKAQQFDLIYAQSGYLYTIIPDAPCGDPSQHDVPGASHIADGIIGRLSL